MIPTHILFFSLVNEAKEPDHTNAPNPTRIHQSKRFKWWLRMATYSFFLLSGQAVATLLGRLYYDNGGKSKWIGSLVQLVGFPILLPFYFIPSFKNAKLNSIIDSKPPSKLVLASVYVVLGLIVAGDCYLYSFGLLYLPVSTYSLICASQLAFNAFFSFFLNSQKFTPYIVNSLVILTISSILLVFHQANSQDSSEVSKAKYVAGFICTIAASAGYGLVLSLTQFSIQKVLKRETFSIVFDIAVYQSLVASLITFVGLFTSGEWKDLKQEMLSFGLGKDSYIMTLTWTAIAWQVFTIGSLGLILEVSSLFSNVIGVLGLPIVPALSVFFFHEKMDGVKVMAMLLAVWGFISYVYDNYLDSYNSKRKNQNINREING